MGNYKFRLSDMMPNAWFYKLRDMSLTTNTTRNNPNSKKKPTKSTKTYSQKSHNSSSHPNQPRQSYYYSSDFSTVSKTTSFDEPPRRSASKQNRKARRKTVYKPSPRRTPPSSADHRHCSCQNHHQVHHHHQHDLDFAKSPVSSEFESDVFDYANDHESQNGQASRRSSSCSCGFSSSATDIIIDVESRSYGFDSMLELDLPPILTKPAQHQTKTVSLSSLSSVQKDRETVPVPASIPKETATRKSVSSGIKLRGKSNSSPRIQPNSSRRKSVSRRESRKSEAQKKAGFSESFAIVKASVDPEKDFRESMMEMIVENNIRASKDLEELLACYLSLNSDEYHGLIIKAFEQIWFNLPDLKS